jgi:hypothetical protein
VLDRGSVGGYGKRGATDLVNNHGGGSFGGKMFEMSKGREGLKMDRGRGRFLSAIDTGWVFGRK